MSKLNQNWFENSHNNFFVQTRLSLTQSFDRNVLWVGCLGSLCYLYTTYGFQRARWVSWNLQLNVFHFYHSQIHKRRRFYSPLKRYSVLSWQNREAEKKKLFPLFIPFISSSKRSSSCFRDIKVKTMSESSAQHFVFVLLSVKW